MRHEEAQLELEKAANKLLEFFNSVQIVAAREPTAEGTTRFEAGAGSFFERYGLMNCWCTRADQTFRNEQTIADQGD